MTLNIETEGVLAVLCEVKNILMQNHSKTVVLGDPMLG
jgi:hypothetical protein